VSESGGWYPDPSGEPGRLRWWDGTQWTDRTRGEDDEMSSHPDRPRGFGGFRGLGALRGSVNAAPLVIAAVAGIAVLLVVALVLVGGNNTTASGERELPTELPTAVPETPLPATVAPCDTLASPSVAPGTPNPSPPRAGRTRVTDANAGISYAGQGEPWRPWDRVWTTPGLNTQFSTGYYIVTQNNTPDGEYYATVLSGTVTARVGDGPPADPRCVAEQVAEDVRQAYYPQPNDRTLLESHPTTVSGHPAYVLRFHLKFHVNGFTAQGEQVGIMVINTGRPQLAVLYLSIPDTVSNFNYLFPQVFTSVQAL
jgi:hypothetical protein